MTMTHHDECWRDHLDCAIAKIEGATKADSVQPVGGEVPEEPAGAMAGGLAVDAGLYIDTPSTVEVQDQGSDPSEADVEAIVSKWMRMFDVLPGMTPFILQAELENIVRRLWPVFRDRLRARVQDQGSDPLGPWLSHQLSAAITEYRRSVVQDIMAKDLAAHFAGERGQTIANARVREILTEAIHHDRLRRLTDAVALREKLERRVGELEEVLKEWLHMPMNTIAGQYRLERTRRALQGGSENG